MPVVEFPVLGNVSRGVYPGNLGVIYLDSGLGLGSARPTMPWTGRLTAPVSCFRSDVYRSPVSFASVPGPIRNRPLRRMNRCQMVIFRLATVS